MRPTPELEVIKTAIAHSQPADQRRWLECFPIMVEADDDDEEPSSAPICFGAG